jgi:hypothetical protein
MTSKTNYNEQSPGNKSKMRRMFGVMVYVAISYLVLAFIQDLYIWRRVFDLIEAGLMTSDLATILISSKFGVDLGVLALLLGIPFGGKVGQKFAEK